MTVRISLSVIFFLLVGHAASADDLVSASEAVLECRSVQDSTAKLACFETAANAIDAILQRRETSAKIAQAPTKPDVSSAPLSTAPNTESTESSPLQTASIEPPRAAEPRSTPSNEVQTSPNATEPVEADTLPNRRLLPSWVPTVSLKFKDKDAVEEPDFFDTEITRIQRNKLGRHFFTTSDGQVWRQVRIEEIRAPSRLPAPAVIRQTLSGAIRIEISETDRSYNVYRVE